MIRIRPTRLAGSLVALVVCVVAALSSGAAVSAQTPVVPVNCLEVRPDSLPQAIAAVDLIVIGVVHDENSGALTRIEPQVYLKGPASSSPIRPTYPPVGARPACDLARLAEGARVLAFLRSSNGQVEWPGSGQVFWLADGKAAGAGGTLIESELVSQVRAVTNQYAVPASTSSEGAGIDWGKTVVPLSIALGAVFIIGLFLMRIWHRIDPT